MSRINIIARPLIKALFILAIVSAVSSQAFPFVYVNYTDHLDVGVSPRALGMGRAYTAAADDVDSIFMNPAGLSYARNWGVTAGFTSVRNDTANAIFGAYFSTSNEGFGIGLVSSTSWNPMTALPLRIPATGRIITEEVEFGPDSFISSVAMLSYGVKLGKYIDIPVINDTSFGISFKGFSQQLESTVEVVPANGFDIDLGLIYKANSWFKFGLFGQDCLGKASGGKISWLDGYEEPIPASIKAGISTMVLGKGGLVESDQALFLNYDAEKSYYGTDAPTLNHGGFEWWPVNYAAIRFGLDQSLIISPKGETVTEDNYTGGIGLKYGDIGFDYAYHRYGEVVENFMHYASISYSFSGAPEEQKAEKPAATEEVKEAVKIEHPPASFTEECLVINSPADKSTIYKDTVIVSFEVVSNKVTKLDMNGSVFEISPEAGKLVNASVKVPTQGKFVLKIKCMDSIGSLLREYKIRLVRLPVFKDVPDTFWAKDKISLMSALNLFGGYPDGTFKPNKNITRAELMSILVKAAGYTTTEAVKSSFNDIKDNNWAAFYIMKGVELKYASGYSDDNFKPSKPVTRAEGVSIISRFAQLEPPEELEESPFDDVPVNHWAVESIASAKAAGLLDYLKDKPFNPNKAMTRAEVAAILYQTKFALKKEAELVNWEVGF